MLTAMRPHSQVEVATSSSRMALRIVALDTEIDRETEKAVGEEKIKFGFAWMNLRCNTFSWKLYRMTAETKSDSRLEPAGKKAIRSKLRRNSEAESGSEKNSESYSCVIV